MRDSQASTTASIVLAGRAAAHGRTKVKHFSDPVAYGLLPPTQQQRISRLDRPARTPRAAARKLYLKRLGHAMALRTVAIDDALRASHDIQQLVILGAGFDARAWRLGELQRYTVFEVDHPATQAEKQRRLGGRKPLAGDLRFVAVNFEHDALDQKLAESGHDAKRPTVWIWEGVITYLQLSSIEGTLDIVARRSAPRSRLLAHYGSPSFGRFVVGHLLRFVGEPVRSSFTPEQMAAIIVRHGMRVLSNESAADWEERFVGPGSRTPGMIGTQRLVVAERVGDSVMT